MTRWIFIDVDLNPGADQLAMKHEIDASPPVPSTFVYTNAEFKRWISSLVDQFFNAQLHAAGRGRDDRHPGNRDTS